MVEELARVISQQCACGLTAWCHTDSQNVDHISGADVAGVALTEVQNGGRKRGGEAASRRVGNPDWPLYVHSTQ